MEEGEEEGMMQTETSFRHCHHCAVCEFYHGMKKGCEKDHCVWVSEADFLEWREQLKQAIQKKIDDYHPSRGEVDVLKWVLAELDKAEKSHSEASFDRAHTHKF